MLNSLPFVNIYNYHQLLNYLLNYVCFSYLRCIFFYWRSKHPAWNLIFPLYQLVPFKKMFPKILSRKLWAIYLMLRWRFRFNACDIWIKKIYYMTHKNVKLKQSILCMPSFLKRVNNETLFYFFCQKGTLIIGLSSKFLEFKGRVRKMKR